MKIYSPIILFTLAFFISCENERDERLHPFVTTQPVTEIGIDGALFSGKLSGAMPAEVEEFGFQFGRVENGGIADARLIFLGVPASNDFNFRISFSLQKDIVYSVRAVVRIDDRNIFGVPVTFTSLGSEGPQISSLSSTRAQYLDTLSLTFKKNLPARFEPSVLIDAVSAEVIGRTESEIRFKIPFLASKTAQVRILVGDHASNSIPLSYDLPEIISIHPKTPVFCDSITVTGKYLPRDNMAIALRIDGVATEYKRVSTGVIKFKQASYTIAKGDIEIKFPSQSISTPNGFTPSRLNITSVSTPTKQGDIVKITGTDLPYCDLTITPAQSGERLKIISASATEIQVKLPETFGCSIPGLVIDKYRYEPIPIAMHAFQIVPDQTFEGSIGDIIELKVLNAIGGQFSVAFNNSSINAFAEQPILVADRLRIKVPYLNSSLINNFSIIVTHCSRTYTIENAFKIQAPVITGFSPTIITGNTTLEITGRGFANAGSVTINGQFVLYMRISDNLILVNLGQFLEANGSLSTALPLVISSNWGSSGEVMLPFNYVAP